MSFPDKAFFSHKNSIDQEIKRHFNEMLNAVNDLPTDIKDESDFPQTTTITPFKIEVDASDEDLFFISIHLNEIITPENIATEKGNNYIKIDINFNQSYYQIILKENELSINLESSQKIKNANNTKYAQSSSHMSRKEKLSKHIDLDSLKIKVDSKDQTIQIVSKYIHTKKNTGIDIEFK